MQVEGWSIASPNQSLPCLACCYVGGYPKALSRPAPGHSARGLTNNLLFHCDKYQLAAAGKLHERLGPRAIAFDPAGEKETADLPSVAASCAGSATDAKNEQSDDSLEDVLNVNIG